MQDVHASITALSNATMLAADTPGLHAWLTMEELVTKYQARSLYVRAMALKRVACHKAVRFVFKSNAGPVLASEAQYAAKQEDIQNVLAALRSILVKVRRITSLLYEMAELWRDIKRTEVSALFEDARMDIVVAATSMETAFIACSVRLHATVVQPLENKVRKLEEVEVFMAVREQIKVTLDSAQRKLNKAKTKASIQLIQERTLEHKQAKDDLLATTQCLHTIFTWLDAMRSQLTKSEVDDLLRAMEHLFVQSAAVWRWSPQTPP
ncbi:hypothetical protein SDRG_10654 [Saprolegnia diclina VS20]|uniref:Uncharacterized protein n=1 Tax=Saprolegnia diclina (strain VS20) TaxID=1156394 RepID=T0RGS5_SAPDV|nr:hypothetical protein SDRG_10654 [Saprolegnia diclina VS20]EQC31478.1 hypothetical protein SDRG_10654 [Saprolegnia diclina VS20]|eukprot:XP_008614877.1 hypothetical protein SDRG_10654 [Saprolegnia diclina VS20]